MTSHSKPVAPVAPLSWMDITVSRKGEKPGPDSRSGFTPVRNPWPQAAEPSGRRSIASMQNKIRQKAFGSN
jgi:hypothetical protein